MNKLFKSTEFLKKYLGLQRLERLGNRRRGHFPPMCSCCAGICSLGTEPPSAGQMICSPGPAARRVGPEWVGGAERHGEVSPARHLTLGARWADGLADCSLADSAPPQMPLAGPGLRITERVASEVHDTS